MPSLTEIRVWATLARCGGPGCRVSVADLTDGRLAVGVGVPRGSRLSLAAAEAVVRTDMRLGPADVLAVVALPEVPPAPPLLEVASLVVLLGGIGVTLRRWGPAAKGWWAARRVPPPEPEVELLPADRCVVKVRSSEVRATRASLLKFRRLLARERGVLICPLKVVATRGPVAVRLGGRDYAPVGPPVALLAERLPSLIGLEEVAQLLERWGRTHPGVSAELTRRFGLEQLLALVREWVNRGHDLTHFDRWAEAVLTVQDCPGDVLDAVATTLARTSW